MDLTERKFLLLISCNQGRNHYLRKLTTTIQKSPIQAQLLNLQSALCHYRHQDAFFLKHNTWTHKEAWHCTLETNTNQFHLDIFSACISRHWRVLPLNSARLEDVCFIPPRILFPQTCFLCIFLFHFVTKRFYWNI